MVNAAQTWPTIVDIEHFGVFLGRGYVSIALIGIWGKTEREKERDTEIEGGNGWDTKGSFFDGYFYPYAIFYPIPTVPTFYTIILKSTKEATR
jgi:hypothetical protein